ncbi:MAG: hypothetical protein Q9181_002212 [Wetmoreana brouardii]
MHHSTLLPVTLLSLTPLISAATLPASAPVTLTTTVIASTSITTSNSSSTTSSSTSTTSLTPHQKQHKFAADYRSLLRAESANPNYQALATGPSAGAVPRVEAQAQENAYMIAIKTATSDVPLPPYLTGLPPPQQTYMSNFHASLASIARQDYGLAAPVSSALPNGTLPVNGTLPLNGTAIAGGNLTAKGSEGQSPSTTQAPPDQQPASSSVAPGTNTTSAAQGLGVPGQPTALAKMVGAGLVGALGVAALL